jgi:hypothetical protein
MYVYLNSSQLPTTLDVARQIFPTIYSRAETNLPSCYGSKVETSLSLVSRPEGSKRYSPEEGWAPSDTSRLYEAVIARAVALDDPSLACRTRGLILVFLSKGHVESKRLYHHHQRVTEPPGMEARKGSGMANVTDSDQMASREERHGCDLAVLHRSSPRSTLGSLICSSANLGSGMTDGSFARYHSTRSVRGLMKGAPLASRLSWDA